MADNILGAINELSAAMADLATAMRSVGRNDVQIICCEDSPSYYPAPRSPVVVGEGDPPGEYPDWPTYQTDLCKRAHTAIGRIERAMGQVYDIASISTATLSLGTLAAILALVVAPWAAILAIAAVVATALVEFDIVQEKIDLHNLYNDLVCAIVNNTTDLEAQTATREIVENSALNIFSREIVKLALNDNLFSAIYDGGFAIDEGIPTTCDCNGEPEVLFQTSPGAPYNTVVVGSLETTQYSDANQGFGAQNSVGDNTFLFTPESNVATVHFTFEFGWDTTPGETIACSIGIVRVDDPFTVVYQSGGIFEFTTPNFVTFNLEDLEAPMLSGVTYRLRAMPSTFNRVAFFRDAYMIKAT